MKRILFSALAIIFASTFAIAQDEVVIPKGTDIFVSLGIGLNAKTSRPGDEVFANVEVPVIVDDAIVIPVGSQLVGKVSELRKGPKKKELGWIGLNFEKVILPSGATRTLQALSTDNEGPAPKEKSDKSIPTSICSLTSMGADALVSLFSRKPAQLAQGTSLTLQLQQDTRFAP